MGTSRYLLIPSVVTKLPLKQLLVCTNGVHRHPTPLQDFVLKGLILYTCLIYLDDVTVCGRYFEEQLEHLDKMISPFTSAGLKLKPRKCVLFQKSVAYLGHIVTEYGIETELS